MASSLLLILCCFMFCLQQQMPFYQQPNMVAAWPPYYDPNYTPYMNGFPSQQGFNGTPSLLDSSLDFPRFFSLSLPFVCTPSSPLSFFSHHPFTCPFHPSSLLSLSLLLLFLPLSSFFSPLSLSSFPILPHPYTLHNSNNNIHSRFISNIILFASNS